MASTSHSEHIVANTAELESSQLSHMGQLPILSQTANSFSCVRRKDINLIEANSLFSNIVV